MMAPILAVASVVLAFLVACSSGEPEANAQAAARCAHCGMVVPPDSTWRAGLTTSSGEALLFDAPKCMFRILRGDRGRGARDPWVIEYYSSQRRPAPSLLYVLGSDVESPMGRDLVPIEGRERAERFMRDHHGQRVLTFDEVTSPILDDLFTPRGGSHHHAH